MIFSKIYRKTLHLALAVVLMGSMLGEKWYARLNKYKNKDSWGLLRSSNEEWGFSQYRLPDNPQLESKPEGNDDLRANWGHWIGLSKRKVCLFSPPGLSKLCPYLPTLDFVDEKGQVQTYAEFEYNEGEKSRVSDDGMKVTAWRFIIVSNNEKKDSRGKYWSEKYLDWGSIPRDSQLLLKEKSLGEVSQGREAFIIYVNYVDYV